MGNVSRRAAIRESALLFLNVPLSFGSKKTHTICLILSPAFARTVASVLRLAL